MTDLARLQAALSDRYRIERELGAGGMATVYLAQDLKHARQVAVKVLRPELAAVIGAERFVNEIRVTANLQHPHILALYDSGEADSFLYYVMPYVEGEALDDRLKREKQLGVEDAVRIAAEVAAALDYAHRHGVVHRDIKPANIMLQDGQALVADFGIALALKAAGGDRLTETGLSLGTPHYMSPEQATGDRDIDARSDVYSLGAVLYEALAGEPPHTGGTLQAVISKVVTEVPKPITELRHSVPVHVGMAVEQALAKIPADRFASAADFATALKDPRFTLAASRIGTTVTPSASRRAPSAWVAWGGWVAAALPLLVIIAGVLNRTPEPRVARFAVSFPDSQRLNSLLGRTIALAPDGSRLVYRGPGPRAGQLWIRAVGTLEATPLSGTDGAQGPFFSPDGAWIGFFADSKLKKIAVGGGPPVVLADAGADRGGTWTDDGQIIYAPTTGVGLYRVSAEGGPVEQISTVDATAGEVSHRWPHALPGGRDVIFSIFTGSPDEAAVALLSAETGDVTRLVDGAMRGWWSPTGHLVYAAADGTLLAAPYTPGAGSLGGGSVALARGIATSTALSGAELALAPQGTLVYMEEHAEHVLVRVDRDGSETVLAGPLEGPPEAPRFSPDGRGIAVSIATESRDVWVHDLAGGTLSRLTFTGTNRYPDWTPDGTRVSFTTRRGETSGMDVWVQPADGSGSAEPLYAAEHEQYEHIWTPDGTTLVIRQTVPTTGRDIWIVPVGGGEPRPFLRTPFNERAIALSPDARWLAYVSDESGRPEVYVRAFPDGGGKWQISLDGGHEPVWTSGGRELVYRINGEIVAAQLRTTGTNVTVVARTALFPDAYVENTDHPDFDSHPTEGWFVFGKRVGPPPRLIWVENWTTELRERMRS